MLPGSVSPPVPIPLRVGRVELCADARIRDALADAIRRHGTLYAWAAEQPQARAMRGRAPVFVAVLPSTGEQVVVRHAWHGGLLAPMTRDRFLRPTRAPREYQLSQALRDAGVPTTPILGFACYPAGPWLARVDVVSRYLPDTTDLIAVLGGQASGPSSVALDHTATLLAVLAHRGIVHPDLNGKNILIRSGTSDAGEALVIDVDVIDWDPARPAAETMERNLARLLRSLRKRRRLGAFDLPDDTLTAFAVHARTMVCAPHAGPFA